MSAAKWRRVKDGVYVLEREGVVLATVQRYDHGGNGHFALWDIVGMKHHEPTLRDAKRIAEKFFGGTP